MESRRFAPIWTSLTTDCIGTTAFFPVYKIVQRGGVTWAFVLPEVITGEQKLLFNSPHTASPRSRGKRERAQRDTVNFSARATRHRDSAKSEMDGRVAVASRTCPIVIVSVGAPYSERGTAHTGRAAHWYITGWHEGSLPPKRERPRHM